VQEYESGNIVVFAHGLAKAFCNKYGKTLTNGGVGWTIDDSSETRTSAVVSFLINDEFSDAEIHLGPDRVFAKLYRPCPYPGRELDWAGDQRNYQQINM
jgi:hypothetical protein